MYLSLGNKNVVIIILIRMSKRNHLIWCFILKLKVKQTESSNESNCNSTDLQIIIGLVHCYYECCRNYTARLRRFHF